MGMFDMLKCDYPLPVHPEMQEREFQTKSLDCGLDQYLITADGKLELVRSDYICVFNSDTFRGEIRFYDQELERGIGLDEQDFGAWREWSAIFIDGKLFNIEYVGE